MCLSCPISPNKWQRNQNGTNPKQQESEQVITKLFRQISGRQKSDRELLTVEQSEEKSTP